MKNISFVTNCSVNTRDHVELLLKSLRENLHNKEHEIIVFIDSDNEGIYDYLKSIKSQFHDLKIVKNNMQPCTGYALNNNLLVSMAKYDIVSYLQSDMVIGPNYDLHIIDQLEEDSILSATRVEPPLHGYSDYTITKDFGTDPTIFDMNEWNKYSESVKSNKAAQYFFAPITFYKKTWEKLGGYDTQFRRSREDSDLVQRAVHANIKLIQTWKANVYHFSCVSSRGKNWFDKENQSASDRVAMQNEADKIELKRFVRKWGIFNHGEYKINRYDVDLVILPYSDNLQDTALSLLENLEPTFSNIWVPNQQLIDLFTKLRSKDHYFANKLFGFSDENWNNVASKFYNVSSTENKVLLGNPNQCYSAKVELDLSKANWQNAGEWLEVLRLIHQLIEQNDLGTYSFTDALTIDVKEKVQVNPPIKVDNPEFDMSLLSIE